MQNAKCEPCNEAVIIQNLHELMVLSVISKKKKKTNDMRHIKIKPSYKSMVENRWSQQ